MMELRVWEDIKRVRDEVELILRAPYDVSLKRFQDLLGQVSQESLELWSDGNRCQIDGLTALIVDSIEDSIEDLPDSIELLEILCMVYLSLVGSSFNLTNESVGGAHAPSFRDAALKRQPNLLHTLLTKASSSEPMFEKCATTCIFLLSASSSLPEPAILPRLLTTLLHKAVQDPTTGNIKLIYGVVSGPKFDLLHMMPTDLLIGLQEHLLKILRALDAADHSANLLCLAILAKIASTELTPLETLERPLWSDKILSPDTSPSNEQIPGLVVSCSPAKHFFTAKRASKTLDLVVLKVILACSGSCSLPSSEIIESLKISEEIVNAVGKDEKRIWMSKNSIKCRKLHEKILRPEIDAGVRCAAINFISSLTEGQSLSVDLVGIIPNLLRVSTPIFLTRKAVENYLTQCDESTISAILLEVLELASSTLSLEGPSLNRLNKATHLVGSLTAEAQNSARLREAILYSLSTNAFAEPIQRFLRLPVPVMPPGLSHDSLINCPLLTLEAKSNLSESLCVLIMKTAMYTSQDEISLDSSVATALLDKHIELLETNIVRCDSYLSKSVQSATGHVPLLAPRAMQTSELSSRDWQESLLKDLSTAAQDQHHSIVKIVSGICQDLEARCDNAEQPFREAKKRSDELELRLRKSDTTLAVFENENRKRHTVLTALEAENHQFVKQADTAEQQLQALSTTCEQLTHRLECMKRGAQESAESAREKEEEMKLAHLAIMTGKDEIYEKQSFKLAEAEARAICLGDELALKNVTSEGDLSRLESSLSTMNKELETTKQLAASREMEVTRLLQNEVKVAAEKQDFELKWKESEAQREFLSTELDTKAAAHAEERVSLHAEHDALMTAANMERESYESTIQRLREELNQVEEGANTAARSSEIALAEARRKVMRLQNEQEVKAKEFAEVKDLSSRLMEVMGIDHTRTATKFNPQKARSSTSSNNSQIEHRLQGVNSAADTGQCLISSAAIRKGPNTRRTKTLRSSKYSVPQSLELSTPLWENDGSMVNPETRSPLKELKINISPSKRASLVPFHSSLHTCGELQDVDNDGAGKGNKDITFDEGEHNFSFDEGDIFTSTNSRQCSRDNENSTNGHCDDTTLDF